jgi:enoyl-CoA hydratase/carnithine racemase
VKKGSDPIFVLVEDHGAVMGGGAGLAVAGDLAVMAENATLGYPETKHGIVAAIVMANLVRQVGRKATFELVGLGEPVGAPRALALGLVNRVVLSAELISTALQLAQSLAQVSRPAMQLTKQLFHEAADLPLAEALARGREANKRMRSFRKLR